MKEVHSTVACKTDTLGAGRDRHGGVPGRRWERRSVAPGVIAALPRQHSAWRGSEADRKHDTHSSRNAGTMQASAWPLGVRLRIGLLTGLALDVTPKVRRGSQWRTPRLNVVTDTR